MKNCIVSIMNPGYNEFSNITNTDYECTPIYSIQNEP